MSAVEPNQTPMLDKLLAACHAHEHLDRWNKARSLEINRDDWKALIVEYSLNAMNGGADPVRRLRESFGLDGLISIQEGPRGGPIKVWGREEQRRWGE